ncbi:MAG: multiheme c-type cytochrome [Planctomycetota bacterium]
MTAKTMARRAGASGLALAFGLSGILMAQDAYQRRGVEPVYLGARYCGRCHWGEESGEQYERWLKHPHSRAYASLWTTQAKEIARLSGIPGEPQESLACLGCHATAWDTEAWERDDTFVLEDGVQCERCHGPGSEYAAAEIMSDPEAAMARGLRKPTERDCLMCHVEKGSHTAVLGPSGFDVEVWKERLAHPRPADGHSHRKHRTDLIEAAEGSAAGNPRYSGVRACTECHRGPAMGYQFNRWRMSPHAQAYAVLATEEAEAIARQEGVVGDPQADARCLDCHTTAAGLGPAHLVPGFDRSDGVQCESCHGPGSDYGTEDARGGGPDTRHGEAAAVTEETCLGCHARAHGIAFDYATAIEKIAHPAHLPEAVLPKLYKTPLNLAVTADGRELWIACEASDSVIVVDTASRRVVAEIPTGGQATDVAFTPDGTLACVTNRLDDTMSVIDRATKAVVETVATGDEPHGLSFDPSGKNLFVLDTGADCISVFDGRTRKEMYRLAASRNPWSLALSPDGTRIAVTNTLAALAPLRTNSHSEVTMLDAGTGRIVARLKVPDTNLCQGIAWHPSGRFAFLTMNRTKSLVPMSRLLQGWTITNGLAVVWADGRVDQALLDLPGLYFPDAADVAFTPDGRWALFTSSGSDRVAVVDVEKLIGMLAAASDYEREHVFPNHQGRPGEFIVAFLPTGKSPRGIAVAPDGRTAYAANSLDDTVTVIDVESLSPAGEIDLGGSKEITKFRYGEQLFHRASITFRRQFSCHSCHPDGNVDGVTYDIEPDGIGVDPVDNRTLRGILDTAPFKWSGLNPSLPRQCGPRLAVFFTRLDPYPPEDLDALTTYICTIPRPPNRFRPLGADLTPAQRRGKRLFERAHRTDGAPIPENGRCVTCHFPPLYTDRMKHDVGNRFPLDTRFDFDTPHLNNIYETPPYLHNGAALSLEEIWTRFNPYDEHGVTNDMTKDELNDLIEFLKTL